MSGWFAVKRGITQHPIFRGYPERLAIWLWLIDNAAWEPTPHDVNGNTITVPRGAVSASDRRIADEVGVGRQVVRTFLARLQTERMINPRLTHGRRLITICNYDKYQSPKTEPNPHPNPRLTHDQPIKGQYNNSSYEDAPKNGASGDVKKQAFDLGVRVLGDAGIARPRPLLGKWIKTHGEAETLAAILAGQDKADPVSFITARLNRKRRAEVSEADHLAAWGIREDEDDQRNFSRGRDHLSAARRDAADHVPCVLAFPAKEGRPVPERDVHAGRDRLELLAL